MKCYIFLIVSSFFFNLYGAIYNPFIGDNSPEIVVIVPSYNNARNYSKNLDSLIHQETDIPFSIIYINDCSTDGTGQLVEEYIVKNNCADYVTIVHNPSRIGALANLYSTINGLPDHVIVVLVDGDDWLLHNRALHHIYNAYTNKNNWFVYSKMMYISGGVIGSKAIDADVMQNNSFRDSDWSTLHVKSFYAGLFKKIALEDLLYQQKFFVMSGDFAFTFPMLEMASDGHIYFIPEALYLYNDANSLCDHFVDGWKQLGLGQFIRRKERYTPIKPATECLADLVVFSYDRPLQLFAFLESVKKYMVGLGEIHVIYRTSDAVYSNAYQKIMREHPDVLFHQQGLNPQDDFKQMTLDALFASPSDYILMAVDDIVVKDYIDLCHDIALLKQYGAYGFYYRLGTHLTFCHPQNRVQKLPPLEVDSNGILRWKFSEGDGDWGYPNNMDMTLYAKKDIIEDILAIPLHTPAFEYYWNLRSDTVKNRYGLCYQRSKIVNIPLNRVQEVVCNPHMDISKEYLLEKFNTGYKIDISPFHQVYNSGAHTEYDIAFIPSNA